MIKYLKTTEEYEIVVPDPLNISNFLTVKVSDYDLINLLRTGKQGDLDDDTYLGIQELRKTHVLTVNTLKLAKRQQHLRKLKRVETSWYELKSKKRKPRTATVEQLERLEYLRNNEEQIVNNCVRHDWFNEYYQLMKSVHPEMHKNEIVDRWRGLKRT